MGKGQIVSTIGEGKYSVKLILNRESFNQSVAKLDDKINAITSQLLIIEEEIIALKALYHITDTYEERKKKEKPVKAKEITKKFLKLEKVSLEKKKQYLTNNMPDDPTVTAYCVDYTKNLSGDVGTIEIPGERGTVNIQPGYNDNARYNSIRDGQLQPSIAGNYYAVFFNWAMLPGWQKWMPIHRYGIITSIDYDTDLCNVSLDIASSSAQGLNINQSNDLIGVPIDYMNCNSATFVVGDHVVVEFQDQDWQQPIVIGFKETPKPCMSWILQPEGTPCPLSNPADNVTIVRSPETTYYYATKEVAEEWKAEILYVRTYKMQDISPIPSESLTCEDCIIMAENLGLSVDNGCLAFDIDVYSDWLIDNPPPGSGGFYRTAIGEYPCPTVVLNPIYIPPFFGQYENECWALQYNYVYKWDAIP